MPSGNTSSSNRQDGFTLVEMLVVAPLLILVVAGFIALLVTAVGNTLMSQKQNESIYEINDGLAQIDQDIQAALDILPTSGALPSPQGTSSSSCSNSTGVGTLAFTANCALIIRSYLTTKSPLDNTRQLVLDGTTPRTYMIVYYRNTNDGHLYRRTIVSDPTGAWQLNSCRPDQTASLCRTQDRLVIRDVANFSLTYYTGTTSTGSTASDETTSVHATVTTSRTATGETLTNTGSIRSSFLNY